MGILSNLLEKLGLKKSVERLTDLEIENLRTVFKARYHNFKLLLSANNKALEIMADMEDALRGTRPFGMSFVRANSTAVLVNVYRIIRNLDQLAPGKYHELYDNFKSIQEGIDQLLSGKKHTRETSLVFSLSRVNRHMADIVGSKMANLGDVFNELRLTVPRGFVISASAQEYFFEHNDLQAEIDRRLQASDAEQLDQLYELSADIQQLIIRAKVPKVVEEAVRDAYHELEKTAGADVKVSMRSSALGEDSAGMSFAGQYRSELNVSSEHLLDAYKEIIASKYSLQAIAYRLNRGIMDEDVSMCVGCMAMVNARSGGVIYSRNPLNIRDDSITIHSVWGLPKSVVDGSVATDRFIVSRSKPCSITGRDIQPKRQKFVCYPEEGVCRLDVTGENAAMPSISDEEAGALAAIAERLEEYYGSPQDIEWAIDTAGTLYVLQCRPLKQLDPPGRESSEMRPKTEDDADILLEGGATASPGIAAGHLFVVRKNSDTLRFPEGAILVAPQAMPRLAALLSRAVALVTEQGSAAGHLANVAREFGIPAILGLQSATEVLATGDLATVDADGRRVYRGIKESLLDQSRVPKTRLMEGSPILSLATEVSRHVVPLNLIDPDRADFKPGCCRTLHDITRFCHEKAVKEMFSFGKEHHFSERASKQLVCGFPMQWWVINLDDGFKEDVEGRFVALDNIVSIPMLSLWEGIVAVPWAGPPPVDSKGLMSILLEASTNPALDPSMPSPYSNRNYFMLSRNFCSLNSRFGFHFSTVETLVGERPNENYISFHFKGGAADFPRRLRRARFVAGLLDEFDFRTEVREDGLMARIEGYDQEFMKERLKVLGYLLIHTRQLDMVMSNDASCQEHRQKLLNDIAGFMNASSTSSGASSPSFPT
ncbi:MAG: PEP/pyruvate-binding domain-containing protein [Syntrophobacteraceae bacterium]